MATHKPFDRASAFAASVPASEGAAPSDAGEPAGAPAARSAARWDCGSGGTYPNHRSASSPTAGGARDAKATSMVRSKAYTLVRLASGTSSAKMGLREGWGRDGEEMGEGGEREEGHKARTTHN